MNLLLEIFRDLLYAYIYSARQSSTLIFDILTAEEIFFYFQPFQNSRYVFPHFSKNRLWVNKEKRKEKCENVEKFGKTFSLVDR